MGDEGRESAVPDGRTLGCSECGASFPEHATQQLAWSLGWEKGRQIHTCPECARAFLRSIEAKLDSEWW